MEKSGFITEQERQRLFNLKMNSYSYNKSEVNEYLKAKGMDKDDPTLREKVLRYYGFSKFASEELTLEEELYAFAFPPTEEEVINLRISEMDKSLLAKLDQDDVARWIEWQSDEFGCEKCQEFDGMIFRLFDIPDRPHNNCKCKLIPLDNDTIIVKLLDDPYASDLELLKKEYAVSIPDPLGGLIARLVASQATDEVIKRYGSIKDGTRENALRHALWNALMTHRLGEERAEKFATAHEVPKENRNQDVPGKLDINRKYQGFLISQHIMMDLFFNELGRKSYLDLAKINPDMDIEDLIDYLEKKIDENYDRILSK